MSRLASTVSGAARAALADAAKFVRTVIAGSQSKYHPDQHYMRGPGPKWREKHLPRAA